MLGPNLVLAICFSPLLWLALQALRGPSRMTALYGVLLYSTFLGTLARLPGGLTLPIAVAGLIVALELLSNGWPRANKAEPIDIWIVALAVWALLVSGFRAGISGSAVEALREPLILVVVVFASKLRPQFSEQGLRSLLRPLAAGGAVVAFVCITQTITADPTLFGLVQVESSMLELVGRPRGLQGNPNNAAFYLLLGYCGTLALARGTASMLHRMLWIAGAAVMFGAIVMTQSRSALSAATVAAALQIGVVFRLGRWTPFLVVAAAVFAFFVFPEVIVAVGENLLTERELLVTGREEQWSLAFQTIGEHPLVGSTEVSHFGQSINYHNDLLQLAGYFGLPAAALFALILGRLVWFAWTLSARQRDPGVGWAMLLIVSAESMHGLFHVQLLSGISFWMFVGLCIHNQQLRARVFGSPVRRPRNPSPTNVARLSVSPERP